MGTSRHPKVLKSGPNHGCQWIFKLMKSQRHKTTFAPFGSSSGSPHERGVLTLKQPPWPYCWWHCTHVDAKMAHKGVNMSDIDGAHLEIVMGSVLHHFLPFVQFLALPGGQNYSFGFKTPLSWGEPEEGPKGPKVVKHAWCRCFISREGVWWWFDHSRNLPLEPACHRGLIFTHKIAIFWTTLTPDMCMGMAKMAPYHHPTCVTSVWACSLPKVSITVVLTTKRVTKIWFWKISIKNFNKKPNFFRISNLKGPIRMSHQWMRNVLPLPATFWKGEISFLRRVHICLPIWLRRSNWRLHIASLGLEWAGQSGPGSI